MAMRNANVKMVRLVVQMWPHSMLCGFMASTKRLEEREPSPSLSCFHVVVASSSSGDVVLCHGRPVLVLCHSDDDKQQISRCSSFGCHVVMGDVAPGLCVSIWETEGGDKLSSPDAADGC